MSNQLAKLSLCACGRLAGLYTKEEETTPSNTVIHGVLQKLLTPYVVSLIPAMSSEEVCYKVHSYEIFSEKQYNNKQDS